MAFATLRLTCRPGRARHSQRRLLPLVQSLTDTTLPASGVPADSPAVAGPAAIGSGFRGADGDE